MTFLKLANNNIKPIIKPIKVKEDKLKKAKDTRNTEKTKEETKNIEEVPESPLMGIYYIKNLTDNKYYVGSSKNIDKRLKTHKQHLLKGCHNCRVLQKDFDRLGLEHFEFNTLEVIQDELLLTAYEKYYIYKLNAIVKYKI